MAVMSRQWIGELWVLYGFVGRLDCYLSISQNGQAHIRTAGVEFESGPQNRPKSPKNAANSSRCTLPTLRLAYSDDWVDVFDKRLEQAPPGG